MSSLPSPSTPQTNATVMASAGTGKTYMLVKRLLRLLLSGARPDAILAVTFTRKAAAEMQSRLGERLYAMAAADDDTLRLQLDNLGVDADSATLERARALYEQLRRQRQSVRTTTFHAFCQEILLRFPLEAEVPPGFSLLEGSGELLRAARDALLDEASLEPNGETASSLQQLLDYCGSLDGLERSLNTFVAHRGDWWAYTETSADPLAFALARLSELLRIEPGEEPLTNFFTAERLARLAEFAELLGRHPGVQNNAAAESIAVARDENFEREERFAACRRAFLTTQDAPRKRKASAAQAKKMGVEGEQRFLELHEELSQEILDALDRLLAHAAWHACSAWYRAGSRLLEHFQRLKQEQRQLDFTDLEWSAYSLLNRSENAHWVQYKLDQRIDHLLVDEFQDTNPTQWRLLLPLLEELAAGESDKLRSVFLVGDAKQSIYRFRRAEPRLFQTAHEWLAQHLEAKSFPLHTSWRSSPAIMACVNQVFSDDGPLCGELRDFTPHDTHHQELWGEVTVLPLVERPSEEEANESTALRNPLLQPREERSNPQYLQEGEQIVAEIQRLIETRTPISIDGEVRPLRYADIMILVRKRTHTGYYEQALRQANIPYLGAERGTLLQSGEIGDMVALLEVLLTPDNNLSLATVLRSPLFDCSDDDLMRLAQFERGTWYERLLSLAPQLENDTPLAQATTMLPAWHQLAGHIPIHDLLDRIYNESDLLRRYRAAYPAHLGSRVVANLNRFLELALEIDSGRYPSLGHFLARLGEIGSSDDGAPDQATGASNSDRVRLLTIHAAKGLEAPVVFLADSAQNESASKPFHTLLEWPPEEARPKSFLLVGKKEQQPEAIRLRLEREQKEQQRESANLLYVALTRARQWLFISGARPASKDESSWYFALRRALDPEQTIDSDKAVSLSHGTAPSVTEIPSDKTSESGTMDIDPRLAQPLKIQHALKEIAPSYSAGTENAAVAGDEDGRLRGLLIHRLLHLMTESPAEQLPKVLVTVAAEYALDQNDALLRQCHAECLALVEENQLAAVFQPESGTTALNEVPLIYRLNGRTVHGIIDRLLIGQDEAWIIDYKSHRHATESHAQELATDYRQQLGYYADGIQKLWPELKVRCFLVFTAPRLLLEIDPNGVDLQ